jgi:dTDP-4-dehydrorhamnose 3,5-epimerase
MEIQKTELEGVLLLKPEVFEDYRGKTVMTYNEDVLKKLLPPDIIFRERCVTVSSRGVLRGIHYDPVCWKMYECIEGRVYYVMVNCDDKSSNFGKWQSFIISEHNHFQILKSPQYGTAFVALTDCTIQFSQSHYYEPNRQKTFRYDDPRFSIWWPNRRPLLSQRDYAQGSRFYNKDRSA